ncbi:MAG: hypothetical protein JXA94_03640 [Parachlamydiales bacterium]|nr:hypothetical protein [Parachlamydiales bacterium]
MAQSKTKIDFEIIFSFMIACMTAIFISAISKSLTLIYFAPFIILFFYRSSLIFSLWVSLLAGFFIDLFSSSHFGIYSLNYTICSVFLYNERRFFKETQINLILFTYVYSLIFSIINPILFFIFDKKIILSIKWVATDILFMPLIDGLYAYLFFALPVFLINKLKRVNYRILWKIYKKKIFQKSR